VREKEVSIRKVMGANVRTVVVLLSKDLILLLLIAGVIAMPIGYLLSSSFLMEFAHRISVDWKILSVSLVMVVVLGLSTVISQTLKVAIANPVNSLRNE